MEKVFSEHPFSRKKSAIYALSALVGVIAGLIVIAYRASIAFLDDRRASFLPRIASSIPLVFLWLGAAAILGYVTSLMTRKTPLIKGSGIPQVKAFLLRRVSFRWPLELPFKFIGGSLALGAGLSLGREGPSIQFGALVGNAVALLPKKDEYKRYLVTAGAAAGISAAFNAPLAGVLFCVEELHRNISPTMLISSLIASFGANAVMWALTGNAPAFQIPVAGILPLNSYLLCVPFLGIFTGIAGSAFNRGIMGSQRLYKRICPNESLRIVSAFVAAALVSLFFERITGGGGKLIDAMPSSGFSISLLALLFAGKFAFTVFSYSSGSPGGIFLPMLCIGALLGAMGQRLFAFLGNSGEYLSNFILIGMVGFFTAVVRAPITGSVLIAEMSGSFAHFPAFIFVSIIASLMAETLRSKPIYDSLLADIPSESPAVAASKPIVLRIPVMEGSVLQYSAPPLNGLPEGCVLVGVERGHEELFPRGSVRIEPGDVLKVLVDGERSGEMKERLLDLGRHGEGSD